MYGFSWSVVSKGLIKKGIDCKDKSFMGTSSTVPWMGVLRLGSAEAKVLRPELSLELSEKQNLGLQLE